MAFDYSVVNPTASNWYSPNVEYQGLGWAKFLNPDGVIEGKIQASFNEFGSYSIEMVVDKVHFENAGGITHIWDFLKTSGLEGNPCVELGLNSGEGILIAMDQIFYSHTFKSSFVENEETKHIIVFHHNGCQYDVIGAGEPVYWVLPISNFLSDFMQEYSELRNHRLRIYPSSIVPEGLSDKEKEIATYISDQRNRLIVFEFNGRLGFIEPLQDYDERKNKLLSGRVRNNITAIMVGEVAGNPCDTFSEINSWFPIDYLHLLGLATGSEIGAPLIELRDLDGNLVRRFHYDLGNPTYLKGHTAIDEVAHRSTGLLLTQALTSDSWQTSLLRVVLRHLIRCGFHQQTILEDRFAYACRGVEALCNHFGLSALNLTDNLDADEIILVTKSLQTAAREILDLTSSVSIEHNSDKVRKLNRIAARVQNADKKDKAFGLSVCELLKLFNFPDAEIIDHYYISHPRADSSKTWSDALSYYRGSVYHEGFFDILSKRHDRQDVMIIINHLHDILLRIVLEMVGYSGTYCPAVTNFTASQPIDWVKSDTPASELGYK